MCRTVSRNIFLLSKLSQIVSQKCKLAFFFAHIMSHMNYVSNAWDGCAGVHMKQLYSLQKRAVKLLMPIPNLDYKQKCCALKLLPLDKQLLLSKCVLMQKVVHGNLNFFMFVGINSFCPEQGFISLKRVSPFQAP